MPAKVQYVLARCRDYNGHPDVLFMMKADDFRLSDPVHGYSVLCRDCKYDRKAKTLTADGVTYRVFADWSLKAV
jgi:hypothetical protein